ncbi:MAG: class I SAM-dependent methyltransferase [Gammaproteobacteria bacterium]|nr:class I SAM-dependent methyltransferase [Gammaproteobacteria bacterium]NNJ48795.1 class I SAM-dependent methyltransferase [Gammaproteobacteria bacterium]
MALKHSYTLLAPIYDSLVSGPLDAYRAKSLSRIKETTNKKILINGIGSGLDIPHLPDDARYIGTDITPAMLKRAKQRASVGDGKPSLDISFQLADSQDLPFEDKSFDIVVMHLILAVVPDPALALQEANRVLKPGGNIYIFDKFIRPGQLAIVRRMLSIFIRHIATRTDVVFEDVLSSCPKLEVTSDEPALAKGWFRLIELKKYN